ncbi:MAG: TetR/AcrR family transcriptional regulator, partial [Bacteroidota bacterium]
EHIHLHGYHSSSISQLAQAAGLGKAGLLHHFKSKEGLLNAVIDYAIDFFRGYVLTVIQEDLPWEQRLEKLLRRQNRLTKVGRRGCFFTNLIMEVGQHGTFNDKILVFYREWRQTLRTLVAEVVRDEAEVREIVYLLHVHYEGAVALYKLSGNEHHLEYYVNKTVSDLQTKAAQQPSRSHANKTSHH